MNPKTRADGAGGSAVERQEHGFNSQAALHKPERSPMHVTIETAWLLAKAGLRRTEWRAGDWCSKDGLLGLVFEIDNNDFLHICLNDVVRGRRHLGWYFPEELDWLPTLSDLLEEIERRVPESVIHFIPTLTGRQCYIEDEGDIEVGCGDALNDTEAAALALLTVMEVGSGA